MCSVIDTLVMARRKHPGQRNSLDALCQRYEVDNSQRDLHGALLDAEILADVYLAMTGGQTALQLSESQSDMRRALRWRGRSHACRLIGCRCRSLRPPQEETVAHEAQLEAIAASSDGAVLWRTLAGAPVAEH